MHRTKAQRLSQEAEKRFKRRRLHLREISDGAAHRSERVGSDLKAARVNLGYDLGSVASALRIRRDHLEAVEECDMTRLPGKAYAIGFIRSYANFLGLDSDECVRRFKEETRQIIETGDLVFPEASEELRLPHGIVAIVLFLIGAGAIWGGVQLLGGSGSQVAERVPPVPERLQESDLPPGLETLLAAPAVSGEPVEETAAGELPAEPDGETAEPATPAPSLTWPPGQVLADLRTVIPAGFGGAWPQPKPLAAMEAELEVVIGDPMAGELVSIDASQVSELEALAPALVAAPEEGAADPGPAPAQVYGADNRDARVIVRALEPAWLRVEDLASGILLERDLAAGDIYLVPNRPGIVMSVRNAGAMELYVDGERLGTAGPEGRAVPALLLDPNTLRPRAGGR